MRYVKARRNYVQSLKLLLPKFITLFRPNVICGTMTCMIKVRFRHFENNTMSHVRR